MPGGDAVEEFLAHESSRHGPGKRLKIFQCGRRRQPRVEAKKARIEHIGPGLGGVFYYCLEWLPVRFRIIYQSCSVIRDYMMGLRSPQESCSDSRLLVQSLGAHLCVGDCA